jgi:cytochrome c-type biogenesis protein CcmH/NrfG
VPYRSDIEALSVQCDVLRRRLDAAEKDSEELQRLKSELEKKLAELKKMRIDAAERQVASKRIRSRGVRRGVLLGVLVSTMVVGLVAWAPWDHEPVPEKKGGTDGARAWFLRVKPSCNRLEVEARLNREPPPDGNRGIAYGALCYGLAGRIDRATALLDQMERADQRHRAAQIIFKYSHPIADTGDDVAAGPLMELVVRYQPKNFMAVFHSGMSAAVLRQEELARTRLNDFLEMYRKDDVWTSRAKRALQALDDPSLPMPSGRH